MRGPSGGRGDGRLLRRVPAAEPPPPLVAEGALSSAFIPVFTEHVTTRSRAETLRMLRAVTG
jgi:hypothetical protein